MTEDARGMAMKY